MGNIGVKLAAFTFVDYNFRHFICSWPIKSGSVCFGHNGSRGCMVTTGPRVDVVEDHSTFFRCNAVLSDSGNTFSVKLSTHYCESFRSTDNLTGLFFILWELFPENICNIWHRPIGNDDQNFHDQVDHGWNFNLSLVSGTFRLPGLFHERIL